MGAFVGFVATAIMFYYSVVAGWSAYFTATTLLHPLPVSLDAATAIWNDFQGSAPPVVFHALAMFLGALACWQGVRTIERANKFLVPTLLVIGPQMGTGEVLEVMRNSGPASTGLTFIWMPQLFAQMPFGG